VPYIPQPCFLKHQQSLQSLRGDYCVPPVSAQPAAQAERPAELPEQAWLRGPEDRDALISSNICPVQCAVPFNFEFWTDRSGVSGHLVDSGEISALKRKKKKAC